MPIRPELPADIPLVRAVNIAAFGRVAEADLIDALRANGRATLSLVAEIGGEIIGHALFFPLTISDTPALGLGPIAVLPPHQKRGLGAALIKEGLKRLQGTAPAIVVLGHPEYYPRFGFETASKHNIQCPFEVPDEAFMVQELTPGGLETVAGKVQYSPEFEAV